MEIVLARAILELNESDLVVLLMKLKMNDPELFNNLRELIEDVL